MRVQNNFSNMQSFRALNSNQKLDDAAAGCKELKDVINEGKKDLKDTKKFDLSFVFDKFGNVHPVFESKEEGKSYHLGGKGLIPLSREDRSENAAVVRTSVHDTRTDKRCRATVLFNYENGNSATKAEDNLMHLHNRENAQKDTQDYVDVVKASIKVAQDLESINSFDVTDKSLQ